MIAVKGYRGAKVAVLGLGRSGIAAARALEAGGAQALCWDDSAEARKKAETEGLTLYDPTHEGFGAMAALIVSPGIPHLYPAPNPHIVRAMADGVPIDNDIGLFFRSVATPEWDKFDTAPRIIAVTGSNGKSTTSALIHHIFEDAGRPSQLGGNIGRGVLDLDPPGPGEVVVLELSSYQTDLARALTPDIAVFTNLTADHLDRHGGLGGYFAAKARLFYEGAPDRAVIGVDEPEGRHLANRVSMGNGDTAVIRVSITQKLDAGGWTVFARKGFLAEYRNGRQAASIDLRDFPGLPGRHNHQNACAAYAVARALGLAPKTIAAALASFRGLPHRSQLVAEAGGVRFVNDSKATNADSAAMALGAFPKVRWIAGGLAKDGGLGSAAQALGSVVKAYLIGHSAREFALALGKTPHVLCRSMEEAVSLAASEAEAGDTVLLAPAAASFDQYADFEARGDDFIACVHQVLDSD
ncbi:MAG: UDP-N-acetylmuramoyl-L-alanine--D-glutamate ligase [Pseudomonadota bacterium]